MVAKPIDSDHQGFALRVGRVVGRFFLRDAVCYRKDGRSALMTYYAIS